MSYQLPSLESLQSEIASQFANHPQFGAAAKAVSVLAYQRKLTRSVVAAALGSVKVVGLVLPLTARTSRPVLQVGEPPFYDDISTVIQFIEIPEMNKTGYDASQFCAMAANYLTGYKPTGMNTELSQSSEGIQFLARGELEDGGPYAVVWQVRMQTQGVLGDVVAACAEPTYSMSGAAFPVSLTLACATSGAAIRYTVDGTTYPDETNGLLYSTPVAIAAPCTVLARAWKSGLQTSPELRLSITA